MTKKRRSGFTLIELMIVVAIVGILAAIAYPSYQQYVLSSWRANAASCLGALAQQMERRYTGSLSYAAPATPDPMLDAGCAAEGGMPNRYDFAYQGTPDATTFEIRAARQGAQASDPCGTLTINQMGQKDVVGASAGFDAATCWRR